MTDIGNLTINPDHTPPARTGVDVTSTLPDGSVWRVATVDGATYLTIEGSEGTASLRLSDIDNMLLTDALGASARDAIRRRNGGQR